MKGIALLLLFLTVHHSSPADPVRFIFDQADTAFSLSGPAGWVHERSRTAFRGARYSAPAGAGNSLAVWTLDGIPEGTFDVEVWAERGDYAEAAGFLVEHTGGVTTATSSQQGVETGWHPLGTFHFSHAGRITQSDSWSGAGARVTADAIRLTLHGEASPPGENSIAPAVTIVVDDLGGFNPALTTSPTARLFDRLPEATYAVIPDRTWSAQVLETAAARNIETILHQPCQFLGQENLIPGDTNRGETNRLYVSMNEQEIRRILERNIAGMRPHVHGVNNHQGSRFSLYPDGLRVVMQVLKTQKMFFCDSRTISASQAYDLAKEAGLLAAERDLFIDPNRSEDSLELILSVARQARYAPNLNYIMIGHQTSGTVAALLDLRPRLDELGVALVPLGRNLHYIVETDFQPAGARVLHEGAWVKSSDDMISHECRDGYGLSLPAGAEGLIRFVPDLPRKGRYRVFVGFAAGERNTSAARVTLRGSEGNVTGMLDQGRSANRWHFVGEQDFAEGTSGSVLLENAGSGELRADCVKFVYQGEF